MTEPLIIFIATLIIACLAVVCWWQDGVIRKLEIEINDLQERLDGEFSPEYFIERERK